MSSSDVTLPSGVVPTHGQVDAVVAASVRAPVALRVNPLTGKPLKKTSRLDAMPMLAVDVIGGSVSGQVVPVRDAGAGLVVLRLVDAHWPAGSKPSRLWTVTHVASGRSLGAFATQAGAKAFICNPLVTAIDWTRTWAQLQAIYTFEVWYAIREALYQCHGLPGPARAKPIPVRTGPQDEVHDPGVSQRWGYVQAMKAARPEPPEMPTAWAALRDRQSAERADADQLEQGRQAAYQERWARPELAALIPEPPADRGTATTDGQEPA